MTRRKNDPLQLTHSAIAKNSPNVTKFTKETLQLLLDNYTSSKLLWQDFEQLEPLQRMNLAEKLFNYIAPKMQATNVNINLQNDKTIEEKLQELSILNTQSPEH